MQDNVELQVPDNESTPTDEYGWGDFCIAGTLALAVMAVLWWWHFPLFSPYAWNDAAVAAGLRPAASLIPGLWRLMSSCLFDMAGVAGGMKALTVSGAVSAGVTASLVYLTFRALLSVTSRMRLRTSARRYLVMRLASALGTVCFAFSDPVWCASQAFTPAQLLTLMTVLAAFLFSHFLMRGSLVSCYASMLLIGVVAAETPLGLLALVVLWALYFLFIRGVCVPDMPLLNPLVVQVSKWHMTFLFFLGLIATVLVNCWSFMRCGGLVANGYSLADVPVRYGLDYWGAIIGSTSLMGFVLTVLMVVLPVAVCAALLPRSVDEDQFLPYRFGVIFLVCGLVALAQFCPVGALWYWTWISSPTMVSSPYLLEVAVLMLASLVTFAVAVGGVDGYCRDHKRLALQMYSELRADGDVPGLGLSPKFVTALRVFCAVVLPLGICVAVVGGRRLAKRAELLDVCRAYAELVLAEADDAKWIFTDGSYDALLELRSAANGRTLNCLSMMAGKSAYDYYVRARGVDDTEDQLAMHAGAPAVLRTWKRDKPARLEECALQLGLEVWKRDGEELPPIGGALSRPMAKDPARADKGAAAAKKIAERILAYYDRHGDVARECGPKLRDLFAFAQWRLSRISRLRAERLDRAGNREAAEEAVALSDELDKRNRQLRDIVEQMERVRENTLRQMTPREGLQLALQRADFAQARRYAEPILAADPEDANANFAMGMSYFTQKQYTRSEAYLTRCLVAKPKEPAIWNNLAIVQLRTGRHEAALASARKALELLPASAEIKDTVAEIEKAIDAARERKRKISKSDQQP